MSNGAPTWVDIGASGVDHKVVGAGDFNGDGASGTSSGAMTQLATSAILANA